MGSGKGKDVRYKDWTFEKEAIDLFSGVIESAAKSVAKSLGFTAKITAGLARQIAEHALKIAVDELDGDSGNYGHHKKELKTFVGNIKLKRK